MPPRRATTRRAAAASSGQQSTLTFHGKANKITKTSSPRSGKVVKPDPALLEDALGSPKAELNSSTSSRNSSRNRAAATASPPEEPEQHSPAPDPLVASSVAVKTEDVLGGRAATSTDGADGGNSGWAGDEAQEARALPETQIKRYWRLKEAERRAPRVHQEGLSVHEKVLREWDMSGQYGPCIGISRLKRWKRANGLGLKPPIEVLAVLLKEMDAGDTKMQRAHVDELMSSRFVEA